MNFSISFEKYIDEADLLIVPLEENEGFPFNLQQIDELLNGGVRFNVKRENFQAKKGQLVELTTNGLHSVSKVILVGVGASSELTSLDWQELGGLISALLKGDKIGIEAPAKWISCLTFGLKLRCCQLTKYQAEKQVNIVFLSDDPDMCRQMCKERNFLYQGIKVARELTAESASDFYPNEFAWRCFALSRDGVEVKMLNENHLEALGANALLSVGKGSVHPPRLVIMRWNGGPKGQPPIALVGNGICYDSAGINLNNKELAKMKSAKAGAAVVAGTILALAKQKVSVNVVGVIGLAENKTEGGAFMKPGDIITTLSKKTVEVVNTDYQGRLILADCLWYAQEKFSPSLVIDIGTLNPETTVSLADVYAGLYSDDEKLVKSLCLAGVACGEKVWHLPMGSPFASQIRSEYADMRNMGIYGFGEGGAAAEFLKCFIRPGVRWAHLDIAGVSWPLENYPLNGKSVTGFGVHLLVEWINNIMVPSRLEEVEGKM